MSGTTANRQRGIGFFGFLFVAAALAVLAVVGMKLVPAWMEDASVESAFSAVASDPALKDAADGDIRNAYARRAQVANIHAVQPQDIVIGRGNGLTLSASYSVKLPLAGNVSLLVEFNPSSR